MIFKLFELRNMGPSLRRLSSQPIPLKISYRLSKFIKKTTEELSSVEEHRIKLIDQFGTKNEQSGFTTVLPEKEKEFQKAFFDLLNETVDIDIEPISVEDLGSIKLSVEDILNMDKIFVA
jgi:hypothetical protein